MTIMTKILICVTAAVVLTYVILLIDGYLRVRRMKRQFRKEGEKTYKELNEAIEQMHHFSEGGISAAEASKALTKYINKIIDKNENKNNQIRKNQQSAIRHDSDRDRRSADYGAPGQSKRPGHPRKRVDG